MSDGALQAEVLRLRRRVRMLGGVVGLLLAVIRASGFRLDRSYIADPAARDDVLGAIERARRVLPVGSVLRILRISGSPYHSWIRTKQGCGMGDHVASAQRSGYTFVIGRAETAFETPSRGVAIIIGRGRRGTDVSTKDRGD
jgi:hypothetical protein